MDRTVVSCFPDSRTVGVDMKVGDLVRPKVRRDRQDQRKIGLVTKINNGYDGEQVKVMWNQPTWFDPKDGYSAEYASELEVVR